MIGGHTVDQPVVNSGASSVVSCSCFPWDTRPLKIYVSSGLGRSLYEFLNLLILEGAEILWQMVCELRSSIIRLKFYVNTQNDSS